VSPNGSEQWYDAVPLYNYLWTSHSPVCPLTSRRFTPLELLRIELEAAKQVARTHTWTNNFKLMTTPFRRVIGWKELKFGINEEPGRKTVLVRRSGDECFHDMYAKGQSLLSQIDCLKRKAEEAQDVADAVAAEALYLFTHESVDFFVDFLYDHIDQVDVPDLKTLRRGCEQVQREHDTHCTSEECQRGAECMLGIEVLNMMTLARSGAKIAEASLRASKRPRVIVAEVITVPDSDDEAGPAPAPAVGAV
jgi:hypothetical protein